MKDFFQKLLSLLRVRATAVGLDVSDEVLRLVRFDGKTWQLFAMRMEPGVLEGGKVKDKEAFVAALSALKAKFAPKADKNKKTNVVVSLTSLNVYTQVFNLPVIADKELDKAIALNVQMLSPADAAQVYSGWQIVGRDEKDLHLEILTAFADKTAVDEVSQALLDAGFISVAAESRSLALVRLLRERVAGIDIKKPYLFVNIDTAGMDFMIVRNGALYFEYANRWKDIMDDKGQMSVEKFESVLTASLRQVINFYGQYWPDPPSAVILSALAFDDNTEKLIATNFSLSVIRLTLVMGQPISSEWLVALGSSLRGLATSHDDEEINFLGEGAREIFHKEQFTRFMSFWRILFPVACGLLILMFAVADFFVTGNKSAIVAESNTMVGSAESQQIALLEASATQFNQSVSLLASAEQSLIPKNVLLNDVENLASGNNVTISHFVFPGAGSEITLSATAPTEDDVIAFKSALTADPKIRAVNFPPTNVVESGGIYSFSLTFSFLF